MSLKEFEQKELNELIKSGKLPENTTIGEYNYLINQQVDRTRGK